MQTKTKAFVFKHGYFGSRRYTDIRFLGLKGRTRRQPKSCMKPLGMTIIGSLLLGLGFHMVSILKKSYCTNL